MRPIRIFLALALLGLLLAGCSNVETISKEELFSKAQQYDVSPKTSVYYKAPPSSTTTSLISTAASAGNTG